MQNDFYTSPEWKNATSAQKQSFLSRLKALKRMEKEKSIEENRAAKREVKAVARQAALPPGPRKVSTAQKKAAAAFRRQIRYADRPKLSPGKSFSSGVDVTSAEFLSTYEWRKVRMVALTKYGPKCMCCGATPAQGAVMNVDHIKPRKLWPSLALDVSNLQILCHDCNHGKGNWDQTDWRK